MKLNKYKLRPGLACCKYILFVTIFISCGSSEHQQNIFHYNEQGGIPSLDPAFAKAQPVMWAVHQLYNTLVEIDEDLNMVPSLARSWSVSDDHLTFTFQLRTDVYFQDHEAFPDGKGRKMTAHDVAFSLGRIIDPDVASSGAWIFNDRVAETEPFIAVNDSVFQLRLLRPFRPILGVLSMQYCSVVPREVVEKYGKDFRRNPCGTGPFQMVAWEEGQALIMKRNPHYFESDEQGKPLPYLDGIKITFLENKATEFLEFQQRRLDFINDIDASFKDEVLTKAGALRGDWKDRILLQKHPFMAIEYLGILQDTTKPMAKNSPLRDKRIRQAINYGFNRKKMMLYVRNSMGTAATSGFVPLGFPSFDSSKVKGYDYDPEKALKLLAEAGYPNGRGLPPIPLLTVPIYADLASYIANDLLQLGIRINVEIVQRSLLLEQTAKSEALFFRASWIGDYPDAENFLNVFYSANPAPPNYTRYNNREYDRLYDEALLEDNDSLRYELYRKADQIMISDAPVVPLWYDMVVRLVQPRVQNFKPNSLNLLELRRVKLKQEQQP